MKLSNILRNLNFKTNNNIDNIDIKDIAYNSSKVKENYIFVALKGETVDGHKYVNNAYDNGARVFILEDDVNLPDDAMKIFVENTRKALSKISDNYFGNPSKKLKIIGVTGTKGKTTITNYISAVLNNSNINTGIIGTNGAFFNGHVEETLNTTPESYELHRIFKLMLDSGVQCVSMEVSSGGIMMDRVSDVDFDIGIFSNLSLDHVGPKEHPTFDHYMNCKSKLFKMCKHGIINIDDKYANNIIDNATCTIETFSMYKNSDLKAIDTKYSCNIDSLGTHFKYKNNEQNVEVFISSPGEFSVYNALAVIGVCKYLNIETSIMLEALKYAQVDGRLQVLNDLPYAKIMIDYAHNGDSLKNVLRALKQYKPNRLICLFGSVGGRTKLRRKELGDIAAKECDLCILTSDNPDFEDPMDIINDISKSFIDTNCMHIKIPDREEAIKRAMSIAREGDIILLAGKGHEKYQLINGKKVTFDEAKIVKYEARKLLEKTKQLVEMC